MPQEIDEKVIGTFQVTGLALSRYEQAAAAQAEQMQKVAALIPGVVDDLVRFGRIESSERDDCARALADPVQTLELMRKLAVHRNAGEAAVLGQVVDQHGRPAGAGGQQKRASYEGGGHVGRVGAPSQAWDNFASKLGIGGTGS